MKHIYALIFAFSLPFILAAQSNFRYTNTVDHFATVIDGNQQWHYAVGTSEPDSNWRKTTFNDASWLTGNGGIGYADNDDATVVNVCTSVYLRKTFTVLDTSKITELLLSIDYDDGFVAYINNVEFARKNIGTPGIIPVFNALATTPHEAHLYQALNAEYFFINKDFIKNNVKNGINVLCIQVHNNSTSGADNDLTALPFLMAGLNDENITYSNNPGWFKPPFYSHLPILQVIANNVTIVNEPKKTMRMRIISNGFYQNHITDSANEFSGKVGIELHGASSINFPQKSYGISTYDSNAVADNVKLFDLPKESDYMLYGPYNDKTLMRNVMMYDLARKMGWYAPRCKFIEMFIDTQYLGIYVFMEKIKIDKNRVAINQILPTHNAGDSLTGGYIFKVDWNADPGLGTWYSNVTSFNGVTKSIRFQTSDPNGLDITNSQRNYIVSYIDSFEQNLQSTGMSNLTTGYRKYIDVGSFIDYYILTEITHNIDAYRASTYFFKNRSSQGGKIVMGPIWDFNYSLGNANFCGSNDTFGWCGCTPDNTLWWFDALNTDNYYRDQLRCRWTSLYNGLLSSFNINNYIDSVAAYLEVPQKRHFVRWNILGTDLYNGHVSSNYGQEITYLKNWYKSRVNWVNLYMPGWHNPCSESPYKSRLMVTEINYNSDKDMDPGNWIELYNNSSGSLNLNNLVFAANGGANSKKFGTVYIPAYSYLVICEDTNLFNKIYPNIRNKIGNLGFGFNNNGGSLVLYDMSSYQVFNILYSSVKPWPQAANGGGKTLEHVGINNNYNSYSNWFEGCLGGSPGRAYGRCMQDLNVTEINYTSATSFNTGDWFELKNNSNTPKNIGGYVFKDDVDAHTFTFPPNFTIGANAYCVVCADTSKFISLHPDIKNRIGNFNFGISNKNDAIRLFSNTNVPYQSIYYTDTAAPWPNGANGNGFTIELKNDTLQCDAGNNWTIGCIFGSPGKRYHKTCNPAQTAKLSISEIRTYAPAYADDNGWVELHNYDSLDLDLADFTLSHASSIDNPYRFPENTIIRKKDFLVLCNDTAKFKKLHPGIREIYPLNQWKLNNTSDSIIIQDFNSGTLIRMSYNLSLPEFTEAKGFGKGIELKSDTSNLNLSSSWFVGCFGGSPAAVYSPCEKPRLIISEINYKSSNNFDQGFWIELKNVDTVAANLDNYFLRKPSDTLRYHFKPNITIAPSSYFVVAKDSQNFSLRNPFVKNVRFDTMLTFNTSGDVIQFFETGTPLLNAKFKDTLPYPLNTNAGGYALSLLNDSLNPFLSSSFNSVCFGGSPGRKDQYPCNPALNGALVISEINYQSNTDNNSGYWFELENTSNSNVSLEDWHIASADISNNYTIGNLTLGAHNFMVFASDSVKFKKQHPTVFNAIFIPDIFSNKKDSIRIYDYRGFQACKAYYNNDSNWQQGPNGRGYTLENKTSQTNAVEPLDWSIGCLLGSPGTGFKPCNQPSLIISEINSKPKPSINDGQWFEIKNAAKSTLNLANYVIKINNTDSMIINAMLPQGAFLVIANDTQKFKQQHFFTKNYRYLNFKLDSIANAVQIFENQKLIFSSLTSAQNLRLQAANGAGFTLELANDTFVATEEKSWTIGCLKGSPGNEMRWPCDPALTSSITISEINYKSDTFNNSGPWIELYNKDTNPIDLQGWVLQNESMDFSIIKKPMTILPKSYFVFSNDTEAFHKIYPKMNNFGYLDLKINNLKDTIRLFDYSKNEACRAFYSNSSLWPQGPNGNGRTLESCNLNNTHTSFTDWKEGCLLGSPGNTMANCNDPLIVSEINYNPDLLANDGTWLELYFTPQINIPLAQLKIRNDDSIYTHNLLKPILASTYLVLCQDTIKFNAFHRYITNKENSVALQIKPGKHNLAIYDQDNRLLQAIYYSSESPWDSLANGRGYTLELKKDSVDYGQADNWKSYCKRGSAGMETFTPCANPFGIIPSVEHPLPLLYPNPAGNEITIDISELLPILNKFINFRIIDLPGQTLIAGTINNKISRIDISNLSSGIYFVQLDGFKALKFIKN